jgi:methyl-accepting chemotaxis protein
MKNWTIGRTLVSSFLATAAVTAALGLVGYYGAASSQKTINDLANTHLSGVQSLLSIGRAVEKVRTAQRTLMDPDLTLEDNKRQFVRLQEAQTRSEAAWKVYAPLEKTPEETALWEELKTTWAQWQTDNEAFSRMAEEVAALAVLNPPALQRNIQQFIGDHYKLQVKTTNHVEQGDQLEGGADPHACNFGKWLAKFSTSAEASNPDLMKAVERMRPHHEDFHAAVKRAKELSAGGNKTAAMKVVREGMRETATATFDEFSRMLAIADKTADLRIRMRTQLMASAREIQLKVIDLVDRLVETNTSSAHATADASISRATALEATNLAAMIIGAVGALALGLLVSRRINRSLRHVATNLSDLTEAATAGRLSTRADANSVTPEFRPLLEGVNTTLDAVTTPLEVAARYVDRIAKGDIPPKITEQYAGDFGAIKNNLNALIETFTGFAAAQNEMAQKHAAGWINEVIAADRFPGVYGQMATSLNDLVRSHIAVKMRVVEVVSAYAAGDFSVNMDRLPGDKAKITAAIDGVKASLAAVNQEIMALSGAALRGDLAARGDARKFQHDFKKIIDGVNQTLDSVLAPINEANRVLEKLAQRDLRARMQGEYKGDHAKIKTSLNETAQSLHDALAQVSSSVDQVSSAAGQIASSSQAVADGASSQASSLEETSSSLESMSSMTRRSADSAQQANALAQTAKTAASGGASAVEQMTVSMGKIKASAEGTSQIIKDINEIAFQTNLLALNAAVEAARAGEAGRGFAVVAEEVRSLALRSKEAATKTEELIRESVRQAGEGEVTAKEVSSKLADILAGVTKVSEIVTEISASAKEQAAGVDQVTQAVADMNKVTQQNAANSEESSSAAAELSSQAEELAAMVGSFQLAKTSSVGLHASVRPASAHAAPRPAAVAMKRPIPTSQAKPEQVIPLEQDPAFRDF